jgi:AraC family transcriptional regulator
MFCKIQVKEALAAIVRGAAQKRQRLSRGLRAGGAQDTGGNALNRIERAKQLMQSSGDHPSVEDIARAMGMSPIALSRLFTAVEGIGPLAYMRRLRLERAAEQLAAAPDTPLVEVAFDAGFESQQTFTRAFSSVFGMPPGVFRKTTEKRRQTMTSTMIEPKFDNPSIVHLPVRRYAGFGVTIDGVGKEHPGMAWERLMPMLPVQGQVAGKSFGICTAETDEGHGYMACVELVDGAPVPDGLEAVELAPAKYFVVRQWMPAVGFADHLRAGLDRLWGGMITTHGHEPSGAPDLEVYEDQFHAGQTDGWLTYMVPVKG